MIGLGPPVKPPTPAEYKVILVVLASLLILLGLAGVVAGLLASPEKQDAARFAVHLGGTAIGLGALIFLALWLVRWWMDS